MAESLLAGPDGKATGGDATQVVVHVDLDALGENPGQDCRCEVEGSIGISPSAAQRLACDASVVTMIERGGEPLSVGRKTRSVSPAIRRAMQARDGGCRFPGCTADRFIDAHHVKHWVEGGETSLENLVSLCRHHHRLLHEGGFSVDARGAGNFVFRRKDGSLLPAAPPLPGWKPPRSHRAYGRGLRRSDGKARTQASWRMRSSLWSPAARPAPHRVGALREPGAQNEARLGA